MIPDDPPQDLPEIRENIAELEYRIEALALRLEFNQATTALLGHPGWKSLVSRLKTIEAAQTEKLLTERMDEYELGRRQGRLIAMRDITKHRLMTTAEVDKTAEDIRLLQQNLEQLRQLLG